MISMSLLIVSKQEVFGFYLASIDMRQDSSVHEACVAELLAIAGIMEHYSELSEDEKCHVSANELMIRGFFCYTCNPSLCKRIRDFSNGA